MLFDFGQNMAGMTTLTLDVKKLRETIEAAAANSAAVPIHMGNYVWISVWINYIPLIQESALSEAVPITLMARLKHTEIVDSSGDAFNNYYPGMEFKHSPTCSMADWYERKWYECANQTDAFVFDVGGRRLDKLSYTPSFTYHGFRFVELSFVEVMADGSEAALGDVASALFPFGAELRAHRTNTDLKKLATLAELRGDAAPLLASIFNATLASHVSNLWSIPTDCPQREKRGWMADAGISSSSLATFYDSLAFYSNFLRSTHISH